MKILIDNGHGIQTKGKRSPDGKFLEYAYTREIARQVVTELKNKGYDAELLVPEDDDIPLPERVRRTNAHCQSLGKANVILRKSHYAAVLTENFFMDNHSDLDFIQSQAGKQAIIDTHVEGIIEYTLSSLILTGNLHI